MFTFFVKAVSCHAGAQIFRLLFALLLTLAFLPLFGCRNQINPSALNRFAKTDADMMADSSQREMNRLMKDLLVKLYKRNPDELDKISGMSIGQRQDQIFDTSGRLIFTELQGKQGTDAMALAFHPDYQGDRVFALVVGLVGMTRSAYNWQDEQFMFGSLDPQKLFNSARNIEVLVWRLSNSKGSNGKLLLLSNSQSGEVQNLSYERLFGKMIAIQDLMAFVVADKWDRGINHMVMRAVFLPMGL